MLKSWLIRKHPDAGKDLRQEEKEATEDEMVRWHYRPNGYEFEQALGVCDGQGSLACCSSWDRKESDTTEWLNWTELNFPFLPCFLLLSLTICRASSEKPFAFLHFFFFGMILFTSSNTILQTSIHSCLLHQIPWIYSSPPLHIHRGFDLSHTWLA